MGKGEIIMSDFNTVSTTKKPLDPVKRVKYTMGLVLGVDDFEQEQLYLMERDRLHHRALHGYGTVNGLEVSVRDDSGNPMVMVSPGMAVNPRGESICIPENQCAVINDWLKEHQQEVLEHLGSPPPGDSLSLYVVLCYRECETDKVPIPGAPCRSQDDTMAPSRIADHFELYLKLGPPAQLEEEVVKAFGNLLRRIEITDGPYTYLTPEQMQDLVRDLYKEIGSPPELSPPEETSPPGSGDNLYLHPDEAADILREGFRVWVTEVRPKILEKGRICGELPDEACVLLAQLDVNLEISEEILHVDTADPGILIIEDNRPILLHTRLLQEWLLCRSMGTAASGGVTQHSDLNGLDQDDHKIYLLANGTRALTGNWSAGNNKITTLAEASANGDAVRFEQAVKVGDKAGGDLDGTYPGPTVIGLQNRLVSDVNPQPDEVLTWDGSQWIPKPVTPAEKVILPLVTITPIAAAQFNLWFHLDAPGNRAAVGEYSDGCIEIVQEAETAPFYVRKLDITDNSKKGRNVWELKTNQTRNQLLRFRFDLSKIIMEGGDPLKKYAQDSNIGFVGQDSKNVVTVFVRVQLER
jgi:hypothetical protein